MATITITGGTGMIGSALTKSLLQKGHKIIVLTRKAKPPLGNVQYREWDIEAGKIDPAAIADADYIIHLAGANVADGRWTEQRKREISDSRLKSGSLLVKSLHTIPNKVRAVVSASAQGWYGEDPTIPNPHPFLETAPANTDFLGLVCKAWEESVAPIAAMGKRLVILRIGIVLSTDGGAYAEFRKPVKFGAAAILGKGNQVVSWIHLEDLVRLFTMAVENDNWNGVYNAVAPNPVSNSLLVREIAKQRGGFSIPFHVPAAALKIALGEMSVEVLKSTTVSSKKTEGNGFQFLYASIGSAVADLERNG